MVGGKHVEGLTFYIPNHVASFSDKNLKLTILSIISKVCNVLCGHLFSFRNLLLPFSKEMYKKDIVWHIVCFIYFIEQ